METSRGGPSGSSPWPERRSSSRTGARPPRFSTSSHVIRKAAYSAIEFGETRGRQAITVTFRDGSTFGPHRVTDIDVLDRFGRIIGTLYDFADDAVMKAGWNWNLFNNDGSLDLIQPAVETDTTMNV